MGSALQRTHTTPLACLPAVHPSGQCWHPPGVPRAQEAGGKHGGPGGTVLC